MRPVSDEYKLQAQSLPEVQRIWEQATVDLKDEVRAEAGGALRKGNLLNAFAIWCLLQPADEQKRIAKFGLKALEYLKSRDQELDLRKITLEEFGTMIGSADPTLDDRPDTPATPAHTRKGKSSIPSAKPKRQSKGSG